MVTKDLFGNELPFTKDPALGEPYVMRGPCKWCFAEGKENIAGLRRDSNGQDTVRCALCMRHCYNAPKKETGTPQRNVKSRPDLKDGQRDRILLKCRGMCFNCGKSPIRDGIILHVAHLVSVAGNKTLEHPLSDEVLYSDANLAAACEECNLSMKTRSIEPEIMARLVLMALERNGEP